MKNLLKDSLLNVIICFFGILLVDWVSVPLLNQPFSNGFLIDLSYSVSLGLFYFSIRSDYELKGLQRKVFSKFSLIVSLFVSYITFTKDFSSPITITLLTLCFLMILFPLFMKKLSTIKAKL